MGWKEDVTCNRECTQNFEGETSCEDPHKRACRRNGTSKCILEEQGTAVAAGFCWLTLHFIGRVL